MAVILVQAQTDQHWQQARLLVEEYAAALGVDLSFQDFGREVAHLAGEYGPPAGAFLLACDDGEPLGCIALRPHAPGTGEIKRLYLRPPARGRGVGRQLATTAIAAARDRGYTRLLLDTLPTMAEAQALYLSLGFRPIAPYRFNPVPGTVYMELILADGG